jgi:hypothetical protein
MKNIGARIMSWIVALGICGVATVVVNAILDVFHAGFHLFFFPIPRMRVP